MAGVGGVAAQLRAETTDTAQLVGWVQQQKQWAMNPLTVVVAAADIAAYGYPAASLFSGGAGEAEAAGDAEDGGTGGGQEEVDEEEATAADEDEDEEEEEEEEEEEDDDDDDDDED